MTKLNFLGVCVVFGLVIASAFGANEPQPVFALREGACDLVNYCGRTPAQFFTTNGVTALRFARVEPASDKKVLDAKSTKWGFRTKRFAVRSGEEYFVRLACCGNLPLHSIPAIRWYDEAGKPLIVRDPLGRQVELVAPWSMTGLKDAPCTTKSFHKGLVPAGAAFASLHYVVEYPFLKTGGEVVVTSADYYSHPRGEAWAFDDTDAPELTMLTPSPQADLNTPLRFTITDKSGVDWSSVVLKLDHKEISLASLRREGDVFVYEPKEPWAEDSVHAIDLTAKDVNGYDGVNSGFVAFTRRPVKHPKCTVRDDGVILLDGKPFFPIGFCRARPCAGNGNDISAGVKEWKKKGLNCLHTYYVQGTNTWGGADAVEQGRKLAEACAREGMYLFHEPAYRRPFGGSAARDQAIAKNAIAFREYPMQFIWGIGDDSHMHQTPADMKRFYRLMRAIDPDVLLCSFDGQPDDVTAAPFAPWFDILAIETYPFYCAAPQAAEMANAARTITDGWASLAYSGVKNRTVIAGPQYFEGWTLWKRLPANEEVRCMTFATLACRARGLMFYASTAEPVAKGQHARAILDDPRIKEGFFDIIAEIKPIEASLVKRDAVEQPRIEILAQPKNTSPRSAAIRCLLKEDGLLIAANTAPGPVIARITLPGGESFRQEFTRFGVLIRPAAK